MDASDAGGKFYAYSGEVPPAGAVLALGAGILAAAVLGLAYGFLTVHVPFIYINLLATIGFGVGCGWVVATGARKGGVQSPVVVSVLGLIAGIAAEYFNWVFWVYALTECKLLTFQPGVLLELAGGVMEEGTWGLSSSGPVTGMALLAVWVIEAGILVVAAFLVAKGSFTRHLCCPRCKTWFANATKTLQFRMPALLAPVRERLDRLDFTVVSELEPLGASPTSPFLTLDLYFCPACSEFGCFTLSKVELVQKKDEVQAKATPLIHRQLIPVENLSSLLSA